MSASIFLSGFHGTFLNQSKAYRQVSRLGQQQSLLFLLGRIQMFDTHPNIHTYH